MQPLASLSLLITLSTCVYSQLTPWDNQLFDFGWNPWEPTITRCSVIQDGWTERTTSNPHSQAPYTLTALLGGNLPLDIGTSSTLLLNWTVQLPTGGPYIVTMRDANGYTGGDSLVFNVVDATTGTCGTSTFTANTLQVTSTGSLAECSDIVLTAQGGSAPYTMKVYAGERPPKTTTWTTSTMAYTIDMQPSEQFFVLITDANGNSALDGLHTVTAGDSSCYGVAPTVTVASIATTLSYNPSATSATWSHTSTSGSTSSSHSTSSRTVLNTGTDTVTTTITLADGSKTVATLPPGSTLTLPEQLNANSSNNNLPAIVGGTVGGVALIVIFLLVCFFQRRHAAQKRRLEEQQDAYAARRLTNSGLPMAATNIQPYNIAVAPTTNLTPEHAPLMSHMSSYSASTAPLVPTPTPSAHSYFGNNAAYAAAGPAPWANPESAYHSSSAYPAPASPQPSSSSRPMSSMTSPSASGAEGSASGLPPGAMAPIMRSGSVSAPMHEKATFSSSMNEKAIFRPAERPPVAAPPPYSNS